MYSKILVPLDGSPTAEAILNDVQELASKLGAELILFQSIPSFADLTSGSHIAGDVARKAIEEDRQTAIGYLEPLVEKLRGAGINASYDIGEGPAGATILSHCIKEDVSLVAMTTHGRSGLKRTLFGSVADEVMRNSHLPILMLRPSE
jgi:nucleotide-binding universal stress UspA family protein